MSKKLIAFNWKMYPQKLKDVEGIILTFDGIKVDLKKYELAIAPPALYIPMISDYVRKAHMPIELVTQNCAWEQEGALTGEISPRMVKQFGARASIVGHSERRIHFGETDAMVGKRVAAVIDEGMTAIVCIGEPLGIRKRGKNTVKEYLRRQIDGAFREVQFPALRSKKIVIAYEPIWAIGTGIAAMPNDVVEMIEFIRTIVETDYAMHHTRILYGGSVNGSNLHDFIDHPKIDGALVGGASVHKKELQQILKTLS